MHDWIVLDKSTHRRSQQQCDQRLMWSIFGSLRLCSKWCMRRWRSVEMKKAWLALHTWRCFCCSPATTARAPSARAAWQILRNVHVPVHYADLAPTDLKILIFSKNVSKTWVSGLRWRWNLAGRRVRIWPTSVAGVERMQALAAKLRANQRQKIAVLKLDR